MSSLYIHFPFCLYKCHYCDFNSHARARDKIPFQAYADALVREFQGRRRLFEQEGRHFFPSGTRLKTIFFGGGTPSLMPAPLISKILAEAAKYFGIDAGTEVTLEANPGTLQRGALKDLMCVGVNRLSLGVQSLHDAYLSAFGRIHTADEAREAIEEVSNIFHDWSTDFIFGFPGQTGAEWQKDLLEILAFQPPHLSAYAFTVEKDAPYARMVGKVRDGPDEDLQGEMMEETRMILEEAGYDRYEISNFCREGKGSRHNLNYWNYGPFLGIGAGAFSFFFDGKKEGIGYRTENIPGPEAYMRAISREWFTKEEISLRVGMGEFMMMGLRLKNGISRENFQKLFSLSPEKAFPEEAAGARKKGWLEDAAFRLTPGGVHFFNQVASSFL